MYSSDIWAFGCMLYQFLVGKPPFRGATDYLTFQKILKRDMEYPEEMDPDARSLIDLLLVSASLDSSELQTEWLHRTSTLCVDLYQSASKITLFSPLWTFRRSGKSPRSHWRLV